jgi:acetyltransferase-like isoleucine patch superfamily enzyme
MNVEKYMEQMNRAREERGFRPIDEMYELAKENTIFNLFSVLISRSVCIGKGNIIYPNVRIENIAGTIIIGENNNLFNGTTIQNLSGKIEIGNANEIGENAISIKNGQGKIEIKDNCRLMNGAQIMDDCYLGNGTQVLGNIKVNGCILADGESYKEKNPNKRGGVLKGFGTAKKLRIEIGMVINGNGSMTVDMIERQEKYHPNWMGEH